MAKNEFSCAQCGAPVAVWGRNKSDAARRARWHQAEGHLCETCEAARRAAEHAAENAASAAANAAATLPELTGTEKQIAWAETLRQKMLARAHEYAPLMDILRDVHYMRTRQGVEEIIALRAAMDEAAKNIPERGRYHALASADNLMRAVESAARYQKFLEIMARETRASWWINHRDAEIREMVKSLKTEIDAEQASVAAQQMPAEQAAVVEAAQAEALLKPAVAPKSTQIAEITLVGDQLRVSFAEKREDFRLIMRAMMFVWDKSARIWVRSLGITTGDPVDRQAETAHRIVAAGFMARLYDVAARARAISGEFQPEQTRWITKTGDGWCMISWAKQDDFYAPAKRILGARYMDGHIYVPPGSILEVIDFAEEYGFSVSPGVQKMLDAHRAALAAGAVIADPKRGPEPVRIEDAPIPPKLVPDADGEVDPALRESV
ncbi:MAG: hypothetical protein LBP58_03145 [Azoarcus sp.]|nr:hypothetical protein [Azoarcus sp.]